MHSALDTVAKFETDLTAQSGEAETLRKQNRALQRERNALERRLYTELASWDRAKAEWGAEEHRLREAVKAQRLQRQKAAASASSSAAAGDAAWEDSEIGRALREENRQKDEQIVELLGRASESAQSVEEVTERLTGLLEEVEVLRHEVSELAGQNQGLMEENESFQMLLHERTVSGAFATSGILKSTSQALGSLDLSMSLGDELDVRSSREQELKAQVHALTLYINRILSKIAVDERLEAALFQSDDKSKAPSAPAPAVSAVTHGAGDATTLVVEPEAEAAEQERAVPIDEGDEAYAPPPGFGRSGGAALGGKRKSGAAAALFLDAASVGGFIRRLSNTFTAMLPHQPAAPHAPPVDLAAEAEAENAAATDASADGEAPAAAAAGLAVVTEEAEVVEAVESKAGEAGKLTGEAVAAKVEVVEVQLV
ncbi:hypothetical protein HK405_011410 [Cladochytrium tenue]|nr:hypothetical protein HK405_011410 [Cladochytrium tenue]